MMPSIALSNKTWLLQLFLLQAPCFQARSCSCTLYESLPASARFIFQTNIPVSRSVTQESNYVIGIDGNPVCQGCQIFASPPMYRQRPRLYWIQHTVLNSCCLALTPEINSSTIGQYYRSIIWIAFLCSCILRRCVPAGYCRAAVTPAAVHRNQPANTKQIDLHEKKELESAAIAQNCNIRW